MRKYNNISIKFMNNSGRKNSWNIYLKRQKTFKIIISNYDRNITQCNQYLVWINLVIKISSKVYNWLVYKLIIKYITNIFVLIML